MSKSKMLISLFGYLDGYNGKFLFDVGKPYEDVPYMGMRIGCALMGALVVPLSFFTVWYLTFSLPAAAFTCIFLIFDNAMVTLNRFILLDPVMLFFISATVFSMTKFHGQKKRPFSVKWWFWLSSTGFFMTGSFSVKFVGLFVVILVGFRAIAELWDILGDLSYPVSYTAKHFTARALCLIALPIVLYLSIFYVHLKILKYGGEEDEFFSSTFQLSLQGNYFNGLSGPKEVAYGAVIRLKNTILEGQYLHSHRELYPVGARQQQITMLYLQDPNNRWFIKRHDKPHPPWNSTDPIDYVRNGDLIRLEHRTTGRNLHCHRGPAPVSYKLYQVTGYGWKGEGDDDDIWRLEIIGGKEGEILETLHHNFRLVSRDNNCVLTTTEYNYPEWGFGQTEVACNPKKHDDRSLWHIDDNKYPRLANVSYKIFELSFFQRFLESHEKMLTGNSAFKPKISDFNSRPWMWPLNLRGQFFSVEQLVVYLLGNPLIWWGHVLYFLFYFGLWAINSVNKKRAVVLSARQSMLQERALKACKWIFIGFLCHYFPFWPMSRILYIHHYFPALLFSNMLSGVILDYLLETFVEKMRPNFYNYFMAGMLLAFAYTFYLFSPTTYGYPNKPSHMNDSAMHGMKWLPTWEF